MAMNTFKVSKVELINEPKTQTEYRYVTIISGSSSWTFGQVTGRYNYISVRKNHANPFGGLGNRYDSWEEAQAHYKSPQMKTFLTRAAIACQIHQQQTQA